METALLLPSTSTSNIVAPAVSGGQSTCLPSAPAPLPGRCPACEAPGTRGRVGQDPADADELSSREEQRLQVFSQKVNIAATPSLKAVQRSQTCPTPPAFTQQRRHPVPGTLTQTRMLLPAAALLQTGQTADPREAELLVDEEEEDGEQQDDQAHRGQEADGLGGDWEEGEGEGTHNDTLIRPHEQTICTRTHTHTRRAHMV